VVELFVKIRTSVTKYQNRGKMKTYNTEDSLVVTHPTTSSAVTGLSMGERTGSRVLQYVWSYVIDSVSEPIYVPELSRVGSLWSCLLPALTRSQGKGAACA
jgi:hypothetical protein